MKLLFDKLDALFEFARKPKKNLFYFRPPVGVSLGR